MRKQIITVKYWSFSGSFAYNLQWCWVEIKRTILYYCWSDFLFEFTNLL